MGKISKLMKLLSASVVVAGANSVALAECGLCREGSHDRGSCPHFDYEGYGKKIGYYGTKIKPEEVPLSDSDRVYIGRIADNAKNKAEVLRNFLHTSTSTISSATPSGETAGSTDTGVVASYGNTWSNTETASQGSNEKQGASDKIIERTQSLENSATAVSESDAAQSTTTVGTQFSREDSERMRQAVTEDVYTEAAQAGNRTRWRSWGRQDARRELEDMVRQRNEQPERRGGVGTQTADNAEEAMETLLQKARNQAVDEARRTAAENQRRIRNNKKAQQRDSEELKSMLEGRVSEDRRNERWEREAQARDLAEKREEIKEEIERGKALQKLFEEPKSGADIMQENNAAAKKLQARVRGMQARKKAAELKAEADKGKIQEHRENAAARKITEALRANKKRKEAEHFAEEQRRLEEEEAHKARVRAGIERVQREQEERLFAENKRKMEELDREHQLTSEKTDGSVADEEVETEHWSLPQATAWYFKGFDFERNRKSYERWARQQLEDLSVRKIEFLMFVISVSYRELLSDGAEAEASIFEAVADVDDIYHYTGTNAALLNVVNAWNNADKLEEFVTDLNKLGAEELNGVLYYIASRYMHLLLPENGKKAASLHFVELAKAILKHFDVDWDTEDVKFVPDNKDVREAPRDPVNFKAADKGIVETEAPETTAWDAPYRVYYAYCTDLKHGLRPSSKSMKLFQDKENRAQLYQDELSKLTIRRLETIIYLAATAYECRGTKGLVDIDKGIEDVRNVFPESGKAQPNARLVNVCNALDNMVDKPNDNPISMQPFQKGFTALMKDEQENAFIDMAIAYRKKLREGKRPASMAFVRLADAICKVSNNDGFVKGEDNVHPELKFEEFENEAKTPQVSDAANANNDPAVIAENHQEPADVGAREPKSDWKPTEWKLPKDVYNSLEFRYEGYYGNPDRETSNEGQARERLQKQIGALNVRQLEACLGVTVASYVQVLADRNESPISRKLLEQATAIWQLIIGARRGDNEHLLNVLETLDKADNKGSFQRDVKRLPVRQIEALIVMIAGVYDDKVDDGAVPAAPEFKKFSHDILKFMYMKYYDEEETPAEDGATNDSRRNALEGDNGIMTDPAQA